MKVAVLGNCQAQSIQTWLAADAPAVEVSFCGPSYMMGEEQRDSVLEIYEKVDVIFQQRVAETFTAEYLRPSFMLEHYRDKYVSWPNIYFDGYFPGIQYLYDLSGKVTGPLADYHFDFIMQGYQAGKPAEEVAKIVEGEILGIHAGAITASLGNLAEREDGLDLRISDFIAQGLGGPQMFYAMNHPTDEVLREMLERMMGHVNERRQLKTHTPFRYTLNEIQIPAFPAVQAVQRIGRGAFGGKLKGKALHTVNDRVVANADSVEFYEWSSVVDAYYQVYDTVTFPETAKG